MRYFFSVVTLYSGVALATVYFAPLQAATATESNSTLSTTAANLVPQATLAAQTRVVCSRNRPLSIAGAGTKIASSTLPLDPKPLDTNWAANAIELFCRDVRINTIVVRDYCALIRQ